MDSMRDFGIVGFPRETRQWLQPWLFKLSAKNDKTKSNEKYGQEKSKHNAYPELDRVPVPCNNLSTPIPERSHLHILSSDVEKKQAHCPTTNGKDYISF